jgi:hypothetical protein
MLTSVLFIEDIWAQQKLCLAYLRLTLEGGKVVMSSTSDGYGQTEKPVFPTATFFKTYYLNTAAKSISYCYWNREVPESPR